MPKWIIIEREEHKYREDGIRWKSFPCLQGDEGPDVAKTIEICVVEGQRYWVVTEEYSLFKIPGGVK